MNENIKKSLLSGAIWTSGGQFLMVFLNLGINLILARILSPEEFGVMGIVLFFVSIATVLSKGGLSGALIRMKEVSKIDYSTVFVFNMAVSLLLYILILIFAGKIAFFFEEPILKKLLIVTSLTFVVNAFQLIYITQLIRMLKFKERFVYQFFATLIAGLAAVISAFYGAGVWSLVILSLGSSILLTFILFVKYGFYRELKFSKLSFKKTYAFGVNTSLASLLDTVFENIYSLVLGRYFSLSQVGYFYQAQKMQKVPNSVINAFSQRVLFPVLSKQQDDINVFNSVYKRVVTIFTVIVGLLGMVIFMYAEFFVSLLLGAKWLGAIYYLQLLIVASYFYMQEQFNRTIFKVFDETKQILNLELIKKSFQTITIIVGLIYKNLDFLIYGFVLTNIFSCSINFFKSRNITKTSMRDDVLLIVKVFIICLSIVFTHIMIINKTQLIKDWCVILLPIEIITYFVLLKILKIFSLRTFINVLRL